MIYKATLSELHTLVALYFPEIKDELIDLGLSEDEPEHISVCITENKTRQNTTKRLNYLVQPHNLSISMAQLI